MCLQQVKAELPVKADEIVLGFKQALKTKYVLRYGVKLI